MNKRNDAQRKVLRAVLAVLARNNAHASKATGFKTLVARLESRAQQIDQHQQTTTEDLTLLTEGKNLLRQNTAAATRAMSGAIVDYAHATDQPELERLATVKRAHLLHGRENLTLAEAERIQGLGALHAAQMKVQNPDFALLEPFADIIEEFRDALKEVRQAAIARSAAVRGIETQTAGTRRDLAKLDRIMAQFATSAPAFYADYRQARINTDSGSRKKKSDPTAPTTAVDPAKAA